MKVNYSFEKQLHTVTLDRTGQEVMLEVDGTTLPVFVIGVTSPRVTFLWRDKPITAYVIQSGDKRWVHVNGKTLVLTRAEPTSHRSHVGGPHHGTGSGIVAAPMPGQVRAVLVGQGDIVSEAQPLFLLEAMKMELEVLAPRAGVVTKIAVDPGASVEREQILGEIEEQT